jgi:TorA maturation chaperone TorD
MHDEVEQGRAAIYRLLGASLSHPPNSALLETLQSLPAQEDSGPISRALDNLARAAQLTTLAAARQEYGALFIGIARGQLVPYASFYLTGFLHDRPLARLREDLAALGLAPVPGHPDPEDHAGTLCELMAGFIDGGHGVPQPLDAQHRFFTRHVSSWLDRFFSDLAAVESAPMYAALGALGQAFLDVERSAFQLEAL